LINLTVLEDMCLGSNVADVVLIFAASISYWEK